MLRYGGCLCGFFLDVFSPPLWLVNPRCLSFFFKFMDISMGSMFWLSSFVVNDCFAVDCFVFVVVVVVGFVVVVKRVVASVVAGFLGGVFFSSLFSGDLRPPFLIFFRGFLLVF